MQEGVAESMGVAVCVWLSRMVVSTKEAERLAGSSQALNPSNFYFVPSSRHASSRHTRARHPHGEGCMHEGGIDVL